MRKRLMILALVLIAVLMTCTLAACSGGGGRCSGGHTWDDGTVKEAATCLESGTLIYKCTVCGIKREVTIEALGHDLHVLESTVIAPTCEVDGYEGKKACVREGCEYVLDTGTVIPAIGHAYGEWISNGDGTHKRVCSNDSNHVESGNCSGGTADCGHKAVCDVCGGEYGDFASSHVFDKQVTTDAYKATDATCEAKATYYYSCQCGEKGTETFEYGDYSDHVFDREVAEAEYLVSEATCTSPAIYNKSCACGLEGTETFEFGDALPHTFDKQEATDAYKATDATCTAKATYYYSCDCGAHGTATFAYGDMLDHVYDKEVAEDKYLASAATCEKKATYYKSCYCGHFDSAVSATFESGELGDHVYDNKVANETYKATDATCTAKATYYFSCDCGKAGTETFESGETLPHVYDKEIAEDKYLKFAANCASAAVYYKSCACGHFDAETSPTFYFGAPSGNHVFDREVAIDDYKATDATCTAKATYYYSCECGAKSTTTFESGATLDHTMTHTPAKAATCVATGNVEYWTCSTCSLNYDSATGGNVIDDVTTAEDATNHVNTITSKPAVDPDCENTGLTAEISCADCHKVLEERESIPALGHDMGDWFVSQEPTCTVTGVSERTCKRDGCDYFETEAIPTIAHSVTTLHPEVPATCSQKGTKEYYECENCDKYVVNDGEFKTSWSDIVIKVDATNHVNTEKLDGKAATCTETGLTEGEKCKDCGANIKAQEEIPALGHKGGTATCKDKAICEVCGEAYGDLANHTPVKNVCSCGYEYSVDEIIALAEALAKDTALNGTYRLTGVITSVDTEFSTQFNNVTVTITVDVTEKDLTIQCFRMKGEGADKIGVGDTITVSGEIVNYNGTIEFNTGCALESYIPAEFKVYLEVFGKGTVSGIPAGTLARGDEVTFTVNANDGYKVSKVLVNGQFITSETNEYTFVIKEDTTLEVRFDKEGNNTVVEDVTGTITFDADKAQRVSYSTTQQVWKNDGVTFTNNKGSSSTNVGDYTNPVRLYKDSTVIISATEITQIVLYGSGESKYWTPFETDLKTVENATVSIDSSNKILTIKFNTPVNSFEFVCKTGQSRLGKIVVSYQVESTSGSVCAHENWSDYVVTTPATCSKRGVETATCDDCGETKTRQIPVDPTHHVYNETITTPATCTQPGLKTLTCECGDTKTEEIAATGHTEETIPAVAPGCESEGLTEGKKCSVCGEILTAQQTIPATGHTEVIDAAVEATCTTAGKTEGKHCSVCEKVLVAQTVVPAKGHTEVTDAAVEATCTTAGKTEGKHCSVCDKVLVAQEEVKALGHNYVSTVTKDPTCTEVGWEAYVTCSRCDYTTKVELEALGHEMTLHDAVASTCTTEGNIEYWSCSTCEKNYKDEAGTIVVEDVKTDKAEHAYGDDNTCDDCAASRGTSIAFEFGANKAVDSVGESNHVDGSDLGTNKSYTENGYTLDLQSMAKVCGPAYDGAGNSCIKLGTSKIAGSFIFTVPDDVTSVTVFVAKYKTAATSVAVAGKQYTLTKNSNDGEYDVIVVDTSSEKTISFSVSSGKRCMINTIVFNAGVNCEHTNRQAGETVKATCTEDGYTPYSCPDCGLTFNWDYTDALQHDYDSVVTKPTCNDNGYTTHTCSKCGDSYTDSTVEATGHVDEDGDNECDVCGGTICEHEMPVDWTITIEATCTQAGEKTRKCTNCDYFETETITALGHDFGELIAKVDATCLNKGKKAHYECSRCHSLFDENENATTEAELVIAKTGHNFVDNVCTGCNAKIEEHAYTMSEYSAGTQYADNEKHVLDGITTVVTTDCHFTSELRIYSSSTNNGYAVIQTSREILSISVNAGNSVDTLKIYGSNDNGSTWADVGTISVTSTSYKDYTLDLTTSYKWLKIDVAGSNQVRIKSFTLSTIAVDCSHSSGSTKAYDETNHWDVCSACGAAFNSSSHTLPETGTIVKNATCTEAGSQTKTCSDGCGYVLTETIEATGHTYVEGVCSCGAKDPGTGGGSTEEPELTQYVDNFAIKSTEGTLNNKTITWTTGSGLTIEGAQAESTTAIRIADSDHYRVYKGSTLKIKAEGRKITKVVITITESKYVTPCVNSVTTPNAEVTTNGTVVTIVFTEGVEVVEFSASDQFRVKNIETTYLG